MKGVRYYVFTCWNRTNQYLHHISDFMHIYSHASYIGQMWNYWHASEIHFMRYAWVVILNQIHNFIDKLSCEPQHDKTNKMSVRQAKTQISLGIRPVWSESSLCAHWVAKDPSFLHADSEDTDQSGRMPRLIWVFFGRTTHCWFIMSRLMYIITIKLLTRPLYFNTI